jgi:hypothetical protein
MTIGSALSPWRRLYLALALLLLTCSVAVASVGGLQWQIGRITISLTRGWRLATLAFAVWLVGLVWDRTPRRKLIVLVPVAGMVLAASAESQPQRVGDSHEYVAMARGIAGLSGPARSEADVRASLADDWNERSPALTVVVPSLRGRDGRYDFPHFWLYPALAAPFVPLADALGLHVRWAFFAVNLALLLGAGAVLARRLDPPALLLLACGPILWWVDKAPAEMFTWALLTIAMCLFREAPWWALVALGAASAQNPPFALVMLLVLAWDLFVERRRTSRTWLGFAVGSAFACLVPLYYQWRLGIWSGISLGAIPHWPSRGEFTAVLLDPNIGIVPNVPWFLVVVAAGLWLGVSRRSEPRRSPDAWFALLVAVVLLASFSQAANVNSGATPNPSRYGLWLCALLVPAAGTVQASRGLIRVLTTFGLAWSLVMFHPHLGDHYLRPTPLAGWLWERWPAADDPLPEVFCERLGRQEGTQELPRATPGCSKVLLAAGPTGVTWPDGCPPGDVPDWCRVAGTLCYANRADSGWSFALAPRQAGFTYRLR